MAYHIISPELGTIEEVICNGIKINIIRMTIKDNEFDSCLSISNIFDSKTWNESDYRSGLLNNKTDEMFNTEEIGALTECAVCKLFGLIQDGNNKKGGCDFDYKINDKSFDVKGSKCYRGKNYIKAIHESGYKCNLKSDFYFLGYINSNLTNRIEKIVIIDIVGAITKKNIEKIKPVPSPTKSKHFNYEINYDNSNIIPIQQVYNRFVSTQLKKGIRQQINGSDFELVKLKPIE